MKSEDDPEARIRELEQPLTDAARASEAGGNPPPSKWSPPTGPPMAPPPGPAMPPTPGPPIPQPPPLPYDLFPSSSQYSRGNRIWWIVAGVFVIGMIALPAGIFLFTAHQVSRSGITTFSPIPSISTASPTPSGAMTQTNAAVPSTSLTAAPAAPKGGNLSVAGINENRTIACNDSIVSVSGVSNTVVITGHCASLSVSGVQNKVTVQAADSIEASGFNNEITYLAGSPQIDQSGQGNAVQKG
jgi:Protein of unknown function (DUF3060)